MKFVIVISLALVISISLLSGFAWSRSGNQQESTKMNIKDLPQHKLKLISPSDPSFDERLSRELNGRSSQVIEPLKPFSVFLENGSDSTIVGYVIQWCFTKVNGTNQCYRKVLLNPQELMGGEDLSPELRHQSGRIEPRSATFISLLSHEGGGNLRIEISREEAERIKQGKSIDQNSLLQRFATEAAQCAQVTVSIDAAVFDDGTFVGPDTANFFNQTKAVIDAKRDFLDELAGELSNSDRLNSSLQLRLQDTASKQIESLDSKSTPSDYYNYFKKLSATEFLRAKDVQGEEKAIENTRREMNKTKSWATLRKKD